MTKRVQLVCDSPDSVTDEIKYLDNVFYQKFYSRDVIRLNTYRNSEPNATNTNSTPVTAAAIPYIKGTYESTARFLPPYNIRVAHKPSSSLRQLLTNVKDKDEPSERQGGGYKIKCYDCQAIYNGAPLRPKASEQSTMGKQIW